MKPTILEELWNGQMVPCEHIGQNDPEVEELAGFAQKNRETLEPVWMRSRKSSWKSSFAVMMIIIIC